MADHKKIILNNKKAFYEYTIIEELQVGLVLKGTEVKSLREGKGSLKGSFCRFFQGELFVYAFHIHEYSKGNIYNHDPLRIKKLLLHKKEMKKWLGKVEQKGYTMVPLSLFFSKGYAKMKIGLVKGKNLQDKREILKKKTMEREMERNFRG